MFNFRLIKNTDFPENLCVQLSHLNPDFETTFMISKDLGHEAIMSETLLMIKAFLTQVERFKAQ